MNNGNLTFYFLTMCQKVVGKPLRVKYNRYYPRYFSRVATVCRKKQISFSELHMFNVISSIDRAMLQTYLKSSMVNCQDNFHWLQSLIPLLIILYNLRIFSRHYYCWLWPSFFWHRRSKLEAWKWHCMFTIST